MGGCSISGSLAGFFTAAPTGGGEREEEQRSDHMEEG